MTRLFFGITLVLAAGSLADQEVEPPVFPAGTEAVLLDMVARDEEGRLVPDLRADEVQVLEDGQLCTISSFRLVRAEDAGRTGSEAIGPPLPPSPGPSLGVGSARRGIQPGAQGARSASVEDESLRQEARGAGRLGSVVLLVFDHLGRDAARRAREAALDMIARPFPENTWFAVFGVGQGLSVLQTFTRDRSSLVDPIRRATPGTDRAGTDALSPGYASAAEEALALAFSADAMAAGGAGSGGLALERATAALTALNARMEGLRRGEESLYPLVALTRALQTVRARKTMLYFSEGLPVPEQFQEVFWSTISEANRSNLTVYGLDARGLSADLPGADAGSVSAEPGATAASPWTGARAMLSALARRPPGAPGDDRLMMGTLTVHPQLNLQNLSEGTGGVLVANTNDLRPGLEQVAADLREYYEIAYVTPNPTADGAWRSLEVKVSRPGVEVRARKGYFALPPGASVVRPSELPLTVALDGDALPREVPLRAAAVHLAGTGEERDVLVAVKVPLSAATFHLPPGAAEQNAELSLLARVRDTEGRLVARMSHDTPLRGTGPEVEAIRARSLVVKRALRLAPGRYTLEAAVLDRGSSRLGASRVAFEVPVETGLSLGSLTVVRPEPLPEGSEDLLRAGDVRGTPRLGEPFVSTEGEVVGVFLSLHPGLSPSAPELSLEVSRNGQVVSRSEEALSEPDASGRVTYLGQFPAQAFEPGRYVVHARARQGAEEATTATSFRVVAPEPLDPAPATAGVVPSDAADPPEGSLPPEVPADVAPILEVAGRYVAEFQERFRNLVAAETYRQWVGPDIRTLRSDVVFVTLPGDVPWVTFRDVYEVDGQKVRDREARLEALFSNPDAWTIERANGILRESARFNLGPPSRTFNAPTFALVMLLPRHQGRFRWERRGTREFQGRTGVELRAVETGHPTLVHDTRGEEVPADAQFWVDAETGQVLRTNVRYVFPRLSTRDVAARDRTGAWVDTRYRPEPALALWAPDKMYERYENVVIENLWGRGFFDRIEARARYADYRRFQVETSEEGARVATIVNANPPRADPPEVPADIAPTLEAAGRYVVEFQDKFRNIVAEETYRQWTVDEVVTLRSDIVFVTLPGDIPWVTFRDVYEVNGQKVRDRDARLEALFMRPDDSTLGRAEAIRQESARFNVGPTYRDVNVPTLALLMVHPHHQGRFNWERTGTREFSGRTGVELRGVEAVSPTLVRQLDGSDVAAEVRLWIEAETGRVLRTEARYRIVGGRGRPSASSWVDTQYRPESSLALWVPDEMYERYEHSQRGHVEARARYDNYRRFQVETSEERARLAGEGKKP